MLFAIAKKSVSLISTSGSILKVWALYFFASTSTPAFKSASTSLSCRSQTGPRGAYKNAVPTSGIFWMSTDTAPLISPSSPRETTASYPQLFLTFCQLTLWVKPPCGWRETNSSISPYCSGVKISTSIGPFHGPHGPLSCWRPLRPDAGANDPRLL